MTWTAIDLDDPERPWPAGDPAEIIDALLELLEGRPEWQRRAACRGMGPDLFFLPQGGDPTPAREVCGRCPVTADCATYAQAQGSSLVGLWAGVGQIGRRRRRLSVGERASSTPEPAPPMLAAPAPATVATGGLGVCRLCGDTFDLDGIRTRYCSKRCARVAAASRRNGSDRA